MFGNLTWKGSYYESRKTESKIEDFMIKFIEIADVFKDHYYLFSFGHRNIFNLLLSISIIVPFTGYHCLSEISCGWISSLFMYFGLTSVKAEQKDRK